MAEEELIRKLLVEVDRNPAVTQRQLAEVLGISVGMINWHVRRCVAKGLIKLKQAPVHRYLYYLTPAGFAEKACLTSRYLQASFTLFRLGREQYAALFGKCRDNRWTSVVLLGDTELTELALMAAAGVGDIEIAGILDSGTPNASRRGIPVAASARGLRPPIAAGHIGAIVVCYFVDPSRPLMDHNTILDEFGLDQSRLLVPEILL